MQSDLKWRILFVVVLAALFGYLGYPSTEKPGFGTGEAFEQCRIKKGLDLQGGSELRVALLRLNLTPDQKSTLRRRLLTPDLTALLNEAFPEAGGASDPKKAKYFTEGLTAEIKDEFRRRERALSPVQIRDLEAIDSRLRLLCQEGLTPDTTALLIKLGYSEEERRGIAASTLSDASIARGTIEAVSILERRVNVHGLKEPRIQKFGDDQILIQLPGQDRDEVERVKQVIIQTGLLEFKLQAPEDKAALSPYPRNSPGYRWYVDESGDRVYLEDRAMMTGADVQRADAGVSTQPGKGGFEVHLKLKAKGKQIFARVTRENVGRRFGIVLDGTLVSAPEIREAIPSGEAVISGNFTMQRAQDLATVLNTGSLPAPMSIVGENTVRATLGEEAIQRGFMASLIAFGAVALFMIVYYMGLGVVAVIAVVINVILILGTLALFGATLTLPGIGGIALTLGMAVDSNILVFERIREERLKGKTVLQALEAGYDRAYLVIFDANITTLIAGMILYSLGSGPIKGFGLTLSIGIATTMFTALFCSKAITRGFMALGAFKDEFRMLNIFRSPKIPFLSQARPVMIASMLLIAVCVGHGMVYGARNFGIDFNGGTALQVSFTQPMTGEEVTRALAEIKDSASGKSRYPDVEAQGIQEADGSGAESGGDTLFSIRTAQTDQNLLIADIQAAFAGRISPGPFGPVEDITERRGPFTNGKKFVINLAAPAPIEATNETLKKVLKDRADVEEVQISPSSSDEKVTMASTYTLYFVPTATDLTSIKEALRTHVGLATDPFPMVSSVGALVSTELKMTAILSLVLSWAGMIAYLAFRFDWRYGVAAVIALIHDVAVAYGVQSLFAHYVFPGTGIGMEVGLTSIAAYLTVIGFSVNDTIVVFDRIRENTKTMKKESFRTLADLSINQTLGRTVLTSGTVFLTVTALFGFTATSPGGMAAFAFPMIVGVIVGTYSSIYIATSLLNEWSRPATVS
ncbi:MAG: protein translocase subunit SecD [Planctomycetes bacterium]|nr:protein translocase subunit SecD [Planctomycetota bacterium]